MGALVFVLRGGARRAVDFTVGETVMQVARRGGFDVEGTCEGAMACSTCHVIIDEIWAARLPSASAEESAQLDCTPNVARYSRLGCQIILDESHDGLTLELP